MFQSQSTRVVSATAFRGGRSLPHRMLIGGLCCAGIVGWIPAGVCQQTESRVDDNDISSQPPPTADTTRPQFGPREDWQPIAPLIDARRLTGPPIRPDSADHATTPDSGAFTPIPPASSGLAFVNQLEPDHPMRFLYHSGTSVGGVAIGDVDGDEWPDILLIGGSGPTRLYRQRAPFVFADITREAGISSDAHWGTGGALVDIDNDGDLDLYLCHYDAPNQLYVNAGDGTFEERGRDMGVDFIDASLMPSFCDYDRDGDLDFYLITTRYHDPNGFPAGEAILTSVAGKTQVKPPYNRYWRPHYDGNGWEVLPIPTADRLVRNNGDGTFTDVTAEAGVAGGGDGLSATWWDYDTDGWPDLYVGNDFDDPDYLWRNNGDGTFTNRIRETVPHTTWFSMGADAGDLNNDGRIDFLIADMSATSHFMQKTTMGAMGRKKSFLESAEPRQYMRNALYLNTGTGRFTEAAYLAGLADSDWTWSVKIADLDCDGWQDVFFTNGAARNSNDSDAQPDLSQLAGKHLWDFYRDVPPRREQNLAYRNRGDLVFENVSRSWQLDHVGISYGAAYSDLDRDGDLDLVVVNLDEPVSLYRNDSAGGNRVLIRLIGSNSNRSGIAATIDVDCDGSRQIRELRSASGFLACDEPLLHFGLGTADHLNSLRVTWPSGTTQTFRDLAANREYRIREPRDVPATATPSPAAPLAAGTPWFKQSPALANVRHRERPYDDYARQPLLPAKLSQLGPGAAWADVDGDGDDDVYLGGAAGEAGRLYFNQGQGQFAWSLDLGKLQPFFQHASSEDMAPLFVEINGDRAIDLVVVSGSVECEPGDPLLRDRVYLNNGQGQFRTAESLPNRAASGGPAAAVDFDADGDLDLFIGGRVVPGSYPMPARSQLLRNDNGQFIDVTEQLAPGLAELGMVTAAVWSDLDGDLWPDLVLALEWGPVSVFLNREGRLVDHTKAAGLSSIKGWFNSVACRDLDNDGDSDLVALNFGLNTKYHASPEKPALLFYGDLDSSGKNSLVEAEFENEQLFPIRGRSCSSEAMPFIADKFATYRDFALAEVDEIYSPQCLETARRFECNTLASLVFLNDGHGKFDAKPLPRLAQIAPGFGIVLSEIDGDGVCDMALVHNFYSPQAETGRMDGGLGMVLRGRGDGTFEAIDSLASGFVVPGDAKSLTIADLDNDALPDFVVGRNDDTWLTFTHQPTQPPRLLGVRLVGPDQNPTGIGATVEVTLADGHRQSAQMQAGGGYLSQSAPVLYFGNRGQAVSEIRVLWPDGQVSQISPAQNSGTLRCAHPAR